MLPEEADRRKLLLSALENGADRRPRSVKTNLVSVWRNQGAAATPQAGRLGADARPGGLGDRGLRALQCQE